MYESSLFNTTYVSLKGVWQSMWDNEGQDSVARASVFQACVPLVLWKITENQAHKNLLYALNLYLNVISRSLNKCPDYEPQWITLLFCLSTEMPELWSQKNYPFFPSMSGQSHSDWDRITWFLSVQMHVKYVQRENCSYANSPCPKAGNFIKRNML